MIIKPRQNFLVVLAAGSSCSGCLKSHLSEHNHLYQTGVESNKTKSLIDAIVLKQELLCFKKMDQ